MEGQLSIDAALELIDFISRTNYGLAPVGDGLFDSKQEAIAFVKSSEYNPCEPIDVVFDTRQGNYCDAVSVTFDDDWMVEDLAMGGKSARGDTIEAALRNFRAQYDPNDKYCPIALIVDPD